MISGLKPSFNGIVKVSRIMVDGSPSYYYKDFDSCGLQLKNILLKKSDTKTTAEKKEEFRQAYSKFDPDYIPPQIKVDGYTADILSKVRTGKSTFIVSAEDAKYIDNAGYNIGRKHNLELHSRAGENIGAEDAAKDAYIAAKEELSGKFLSPKSAKLGHPQLILYAERNPKGKPILKGAMIKNDFDQTQIFYFKPLKKENEDVKPAVQPEQTKSTEMPKSQQTVQTLNSTAQKVTEEKVEEKPLFDYSKLKPLDYVKPKRKSRKKVFEDTRQMWLF